MSRIASFASAFAYSGFAVGSSEGTATLADAGLTTATVGDSALTTVALGDSAVTTVTVHDQEATP